MKSFQAVLFDFDGVIAHTQPIMQQALWKFFWERKMQVAEEEFEQDGWASKSLAQVCDILREKHAIHLEVNELRANIWESQKSLFQIGLESDPSLIPFLEYCKKENIKIAIGSNSGIRRILWVLEKMNITWYFIHDENHPERGYNIVSADDIVHHKPDPEVWIRCAEILEVQPNKCLIIEDGLPGLIGAKRCGAQTVYYHRFRKPEKACLELAEKSVESFSELFE